MTKTKHLGNWSRGELNKQFRMRNKYGPDFVRGGELSLLFWEKVEEFLGIEDLSEELHADLQALINAFHGGLEDE